MLANRPRDVPFSLGRSGTPLALGSILVLTALLFSPGLVPTPSGDDFVHVYRNQNPPGEWHRYFVEADGREYRPLVRLSLALDHYIWGAGYRGYHLTNLALHLFATLLVFFWARAIVSPVTALAAAALFALHPVHSYSVNALMGRTDILCLVFLLAGLIAFHGGGRAGPPIFFAAALLSKEIAIVFPLLPTLGLTLFSETRTRDRWFSLILIGVVAVLYATVRFTLLAPESTDLAVYFQFSASGLLLNLLHYAGGLILPAGGYALRGLVEGWVPYAGFLGFVAVGLGAIGAALALLRGGGRSRVPLFALGWTMLTLLPVLFLFQRRFLYISSVGFCLLLAWLLTRRPSRVLTATVVVVGIAYAGGTLWASLEWQRASRLTRAILPGLTEKVAAEPSARFWAISVPHGVGQAHLFTHDALRYAVALEVGFLPELHTLTRIQRGRAGSWTSEITPRGVLTRISPGPRDYFVFDVPEALPRGGRFLAESTVFRKGTFHIAVAETDAGGRPSGVLVSWDSLTADDRLILFDVSGRTEHVPVERHDNGGPREERERAR